MMNKLFTLILLITTVTAIAKAPKKALYDIGVLAGTGYVPDYPASDQGRVRYLMFPSIIYRGKTWRNDRENGARARIFKIENLDFDLSFGGAFPASSKQNDARMDMADLDWLFQAGPRVSYKLFKLPKLGELLLRLPIQATVSTDFSHTAYRGYRVAPTIAWDIKQMGGNKYLDFFTRVMFNYGNEKLNDYFYEVPQKDVTADRERFNSTFGYISTDVFAGLTYTFHDDTRYFGGITYSNFRNATNNESPLHISDESYSFFFGFSYYFFSSDERAFN